MRKFLLKTAPAVFTSIISIIAVYVVICAFQLRFTDLAYDVFYAIDKAGRNSGVQGLVLGDSVCKQLWPQENNSPNLACTPEHQSRFRHYRKLYVPEKIS